MTTVERTRDIIADASRIGSIITQLSFPRYFGTANERRAGDVAADQCDRLGLPHVEEAFTASEFFMVHVNKIPYFLFGAVLVCCSVVAMMVLVPLVTLVMALVLLPVAFALEEIIKAIKYPVMYSRFARIKESRNIIVPATGSADTDAVHLVFVAHLDSKSETPDPHVHFTYQYLSVSFGTLIFCVHLAVYSIAGLLAGQPLHASWIFCYGMVLGFVDMLRLGTAYLEGDSPGANDDASGVAVALMLRHRLQHAGLRRVAVTTLLSGAEEIGEAGTWQFLNQHGSDMDPAKTIFIILDGLAGSTVYYFTSRGFQFKPFSPLVTAAVRRLLDGNHEATRGLTFTRLWMPPPANTDHSAVVKHGFDAFVFATPEMVSHTTRDTPSNVDNVAMARLVGFLDALVKDIDLHLVAGSRA